MSVILLLIPVSVLFAGAFLFAFIWAVRSGQFEDTYTPSLRMLTDEAPVERTQNRWTQGQGALSPNPRLQENQSRPEGPRADGAGTSARGGTGDGAEQTI